MEVKKLTKISSKAVLTDEETLKEVVDHLQKNISIKTQRDSQQNHLFNILVSAASRGDTIENTTSILQKSWSGRNVRYHLNKIKDFENARKRNKSSINK